jgi:hypothetical protein
MEHFVPLLFSPLHVKIAHKIIAGQLIEKKKKNS